MYYNVKSLILRSNATAEADKTIVAYTLDWGKIMLSVPGAKKITAKLSNITEPLTQAELSIYMPSESARGKVTGGTLINGYWGLKKSFKRHVYAMYASEIAEKLAPFNSAGETKYLLISRAWEILESSPNPLKTLTAFTLRMLKISGYSFSDYLINSGAPCRAEMFDAIKNLSACSGELAHEVFCADENAVWNYVESYLANYIQTSKVSVFLKQVPQVFGGNI